jgi:hypothetical protein
MDFINHVYEYGPDYGWGLTGGLEMWFGRLVVECADQAETHGVVDQGAVLLRFAADTRSDGTLTHLYNWWVSYQWGIKFEFANGETVTIRTETGKTFRDDPVALKKLEDFLVEYKNNGYSLKVEREYRPEDEMDIL